MYFFIFKKDAWFKLLIIDIIFNLLLLFCNKSTVLDRLNAGEVLVGDGGMTFALEKRGYVKAGPWTPECTVENPEAGLN